MCCFVVILRDCWLKMGAAACKTDKDTSTNGSERKNPFGRAVDYVVKTASEMCPSRDRNEGQHTRNGWTSSVHSFTIIRRDTANGKSADPEPVHRGRKGNTAVNGSTKKEVVLVADSLPGFEEIPLKDSPPQVPKRDKRDVEVNKPPPIRPPRRREILKMLKSGSSSLEEQRPKSPTSPPYCRPDRPPPPPPPVHLPLTTEELSSPEEAVSKVDRQGEKIEDEKSNEEGEVVSNRIENLDSEPRNGSTNPFLPDDNEGITKEESQDTKENHASKSDQTEIILREKDSSFSKKDENTFEKSKQVDTNTNRFSVKKIIDTFESVTRSARESRSPSPITMDDSKRTSPNVDPLSLSSTENKDNKSILQGEEENVDTLSKFQEPGAEHIMLERDNPTNISVETNFSSSELPPSLKDQEKPTLPTSASYIESSTSNCNKFSSKFTVTKCEEECDYRKSPTIIQNSSLEEQSKRHSESEDLTYVKDTKAETNNPFRTSSNSDKCVDKKGPSISFQNTDGSFFNGAFEEDDNTFVDETCQKFAVNIIPPTPVEVVDIQLKDVFTSSSTPTVEDIIKSVAAKQEEMKQTFIFPIRPPSSEDKSANYDLSTSKGLQEQQLINIGNVGKDSSGEAENNNSFKRSKRGTSADIRKTVKFDVVKLLGNTMNDQKDENSHDRDIAMTTEVTVDTNDQPTCHSNKYEELNARLKQIHISANSVNSSSKQENCSNNDEKCFENMIFEFPGSSLNHIEATVDYKQESEICRKDFVECTNENNKNLDKADTICTGTNPFKTSEQNDQVLDPNIVNYGSQKETEENIHQRENELKSKQQDSDLFSEKRVDRVLKLENIQPLSTCSDILEEAKKLLTPEEKEFHDATKFLQLTADSENSGTECSGRKNHILNKDKQSERRQYVSNVSPENSNVRSNMEEENKRPEKMGDFLMEAKDKPDNLDQILSDSEDDPPEFLDAVETSSSSSVEYLDEIHRTQNESTVPKEDISKSYKSDRSNDTGISEAKDGSEINYFNNELTGKAFTQRDSKCDCKASAAELRRDDQVEIKDSSSYTKDIAPVPRPRNSLLGGSGEDGNVEVIYIKENSYLPNSVVCGTETVKHPAMKTSQNGNFDKENNNMENPIVDDSDHSALLNILLEESPYKFEERFYTLSHSEPEGPKESKIYRTTVNLENNTRGRVSNPDEQDSVSSLGKKNTAETIGDISRSKRIENGLEGVALEDLLDNSELEETNNATPCSKSINHARRAVTDTPRNTPQDPFCNKSSGPSPETLKALLDELKARTSKSSESDTIVLAPKVEEADAEDSSLTPSLCEMEQALIEMLRPEDDDEPIKPEATKSSQSETLSHSFLHTDLKQISIPSHKPCETDASQDVTKTASAV